jgi:hypothetical protein
MSLEYKRPHYNIVIYIRNDVLGPLRCRSRTGKYYGITLKDSTFSINISRVV